MVTSDNNVQYMNFINNQWMNDGNATNHFKYTETINAGYINFNHQFKNKISLQIGLRGEQTLSTGDQITIDSVVNRNYFQLFPSVFLRKVLDKNNTVGISYSRRIDRPDYQDLNPFRYYLDPYTFEEGNPNLQPQLTNSFELSHTFKGFLTTTVNYSKTTNAFTMILHQIDSTNTSYVMRGNISSLDNIGLSISAGFPVTKWWMSNEYFNIYNNHYQGQYLNGNLNVSQTSFTFNSNNSFTIMDGLSAELSGFYRSSGLEGALISRPMYAVSAGIQKSLWKSKASLKLNVSDIFKTQQFIGTLKYENIDTYISNQWDSRRVNLTFDYHFGSNKIKPAARQKTGIEEEQSRIKQGNGN